MLKHSKQLKQLALLVPTLLRVMLLVLDMLESGSAYDADSGFSIYNDACWCCFKLNFFSCRCTLYSAQISCINYHRLLIWWGHFVGWAINSFASAFFVR